MSKTRVLMAGATLAALFAIPAALIPASAASSSASGSGSQSSASDSSGGPLLSVCLTITPKSVAVGINGQNIVIGPAGVPRSCVETPL